MKGFINIYKPSGITSNAVIQKIKKKFNIDKIGHLGTLDPMACGLLPIAIGKATRLFDYVLEKTKKYRVIFDFGYETDTLDITGEIVSESIVIPTKEQILQVLGSFLGKQNQLPPKYSAKNVNGRRAYDLARAGIDFELKPKEIEIYEFVLIKQVDSNKFMFDIACSSGTYIRAIGRDLASRLNTSATMSYLERREMGVFKLENSITLDKLLLCNSVNEFILNPLDVLPFDKINITNETANDLINGKCVKFHDIKTNTFVIVDNDILGVAKPRNGQLKIDTFLKEQ